jgi:hypothetical protein
VDREGASRCVRVKIATHETKVALLVEVTEGGMGISVGLE